MSINTCSGKIFYCNVLEGTLYRFYATHADMLFKNVDAVNYQWNFQVSMTELFKIKNNLAPPIMGNMFTPCGKKINLTNFQEFATERKK